MLCVLYSQEQKDDPHAGVAPNYGRLPLPMKGIPDKGQNGFDFALILTDIPIHLFIIDFNVCLQN